MTLADPFLNSIIIVSFKAKATTMKKRTLLKFSILYSDIFKHYVHKFIRSLFQFSAETVSTYIVQDNVHVCPLRHIADVQFSTMSFRFPRNILKCSEKKSK